MFAEYFRLGGPVMGLLLVAWALALAVVIDRLVYWLALPMRHPLRRLEDIAARDGREAARLSLDAETDRADRNLARLDAVSQLATSLGLFGTVLGLARVFFSRGEGGGITAPEALASGLSTALFTTVTGLVVFLFGQSFLLLFSEFEAILQRRAHAVISAGGGL